MSATKRTADTEIIAIKEVVVANEHGLHARPASKFVKIANRFKCDIFVEKDGEKVNGKSIMGLLMLAAGPGSKLQVEAKGADAEPALREIEALFIRKFEEE